MSGPCFIGEITGISVPVVTPHTEALGDTGIGTSAVIDVSSGEPVLAVTTRHRDGTILTAVLTEAAVGRLAEMMADFVEALPAIRSEARH